jgi:hypothetical protein
LSTYDKLLKGANRVRALQDITNDHWANLPDTNKFIRAKFYFGLTKLEMISLSARKL